MQPKFIDLPEKKVVGLGTKFISGSWLPESGIKLRNAPHLEWYDDRFNPGSDQSEFDILLPVP